MRHPTVSERLTVSEEVEYRSNQLPYIKLYTGSNTDLPILIMKFTAALTFLLAAGANAFSPQGFVPNKSGVMVPPSAQEDSTSPLSVPNMVAGGAERSYGQEYYEGECR